MSISIERALSRNQAESENKIDEDTLEVIYKEYYKNVYNYISFRINNHSDVEELASTVFENVIRKFHTYKPGVAPVEAWLIGIAKNVVTDYLRSKKRKYFIPIDDLLNLVSMNQQPDEVVVVDEGNRALIKAMTELKEKERQILSMKFATDLKNNEIAQILNMSDSNVGVIVHRSILKLKKILNKEDSSYGE